MTAIMTEAKGRGMIYFGISSLNITSIGPNLVASQSIKHLGELSQMEFSFKFTYKEKINLAGVERESKYVIS